VPHPGRQFYDMWPPSGEISRRDSNRLEPAWPSRIAIPSARKPTHAPIARLRALLSCRLIARTRAKSTHSRTQAIELQDVVGGVLLGQAFPRVQNLLHVYASGVRYRAPWLDETRGGGLLCTVHFAALTEFAGKRIRRAGVFSCRVWPACDELCDVRSVGFRAPETNRVEYQAGHDGEAEARHQKTDLFAASDE